jgi:predicted nucleic-acid-binding protein
LVTIVADTNVWARAFLNDDAAQARKARKALADGRSKGNIFVPLIVMAELAWVLRSKWTREQVLITLENLLQTRGVTVETPLLVREAIAASRAGRGGFADQLIAQVGFANGAGEIVTFDNDFSRAPKVRRLK